MRDWRACKVSIPSFWKENKQLRNNDVANNALSVRNKVSIKFHKEKKISKRRWSCSRRRLLLLFFVNGKLLWSFNINFIKKRFLALWCFRTLHTDPELKQNRLPQHFSTNLTYANLWHFSTGGHETFYFVKANPKYPDFLFLYSVNIRAELCPSIHFG